MVEVTRSGIRIPGQLLPNNPLAEQVARKLNFSSFLKLNLLSTDDFTGDLTNGVSGIQLDELQIQMVESFALSDAGALWIRQVLNEDLQFAMQGYLEIEAQAAKGVPLPLGEALSGSLTDGARFDGITLFHILSRLGYGASAVPGAIFIGKDRVRPEFPVGCQDVDGQAILSHEFGHTRFGDPSTSLTLEGERQTIINYENPVRRLDGYPNRKVYYSSELDKTIVVDTGEILKGAWHQISVYTVPSSPICLREIPHHFL